MGYVIILVLLLVVVVIVTAPLRRGAGASQRQEDELQSLERIDLEAARDAKYREIRDAELDHSTGKLSDGDFAAIDSTLRAEAIQLLHQLDELGEAESGEPKSP